MMDCFGYIWIYSFMNLYWTGIVKFRGDTKKAWSELKRQYGAA